MRIKFLFIIFFLSARVTLNAQAMFQATYGGPGDDYGTDIQVTSDGGYIIAGTTTSFGAGSFDIYLIKINSIGGIQWSKTYGGTGDDRAVSIRSTTDGGYIIGGYSSSFGGGDFDIYLIKTDSIGLLEWSKTYGGTSSELVCNLELTSDNGYIIGAYNYAGPDDCIYALKTDSAGVPLWFNKFDSMRTAKCIKQTGDNGYIISGSAIVSGSGKPFLLKIDSTGVFQWNKTYSAPGIPLAPESASGVETASDGGYTLVTQGPPYSGPGFLIKTNGAGITQWYRNYNRSIDKINKTNDGGTILTMSSGYIAGYSGPTSPIFKYNSFLMKTDSMGFPIWYGRYAEAVMNSSAGAQQVNDNGYVSIGNINQDFFLIKTDSMGMSGCSNGIGSVSIGADTLAENTFPVISSSMPLTYGTPSTNSGSGGTGAMLCYVGVNEREKDKENIFAYPNPGTGLFNFMNLENESSIDVYDCLGRLIYQSVLKDGKQKTDLSNQEKGIYFYRVINKKGEHSSGKIVLE